MLALLFSSEWLAHMGEGEKWTSPNELRRFEPCQLLDSSLQTSLGAILPGFAILLKVLILARLVRSATLAELSYVDTPPARSSAKNLEAFGSNGVFTVSAAPRRYCVIRLPGGGFPLKCA
ncbi:protein of unknown function (plasmid) [Methylocella tundrae]|uniref:Uncharacterized protein n=1 Tax=Methylocella tundrae TaxID=227605 RepID=A0A4U8Z6M3_METTU|nr:hypothetical protein [Methylocella tundrae]VFU16455.1 protein of unknown function [Methylocella tundrae]